MKLDSVRHTEQPWRVHALASDFELLDVWSFPILAETHERFERFFDVVTTNGMRTDNRWADGLFELREVLGKIFRWDVKTARRIPGCDEYSVVERLDEDDKTQAAILQERLQARLHEVTVAEITVVYLEENEALIELTNSTIHALIHLGRVKHDDKFWNPRIAIYIKSRGFMSDAYMAMIAPFRHSIVYPAFLGHIATQWRRDCQARGANTSEHCATLASSAD